VSRGADRFDVVVVGAGISGLVTAFDLQRRGRRVAVVDAGAEPGGVIASHRERGFLFETAANSALASPELDRLIETVGLGGERVDVAGVAKHRYVVRDGRLVALPASPPALLATRAFTAGAKLRLLREPFIAPAPADADESIAAFARRRLGQEILDYAIDPFVAGVHAGDPERLSFRAAFPRLHALEQMHGSLIRGQIARARERRANPDAPHALPRSFGFRSGMQALPRALAERIPHRFHGVSAARIDCGARRGVVAQGVDLEADAIVLAVPASAAAGLVERASPVAAQKLRSIAYAPVAVVASGYRQSDVAHDLEGFGFLVPRVERRTILGSLFSTSLFAGRAPESHALFTTFIGGQREPEAVALDDAALASRAATELEALVGARAPVFTRIVRWPQAIPQYAIGHQQRIATIDAAFAALPGVFACASWRGGVAVGDRVTSALETAASVEAYLSAR
jgi:oxygen-dependent protoporphyrinogen oxidase